MYSTNIGRRQFIKLAGSSGICSIIPFSPNGSISSSKSNEETQQRKNAILKAIQHQNELHDWDTVPVQSDNLEYAFDKLKPTNHSEYCFVMWCGAQRCSVIHYTDEFIRRQEGKTPQLPDHPALAVEGMAVPDTYRILVYNEQMQALLSWYYVPSTYELIRRFKSGKISVDEFSSLFAPHVKERLNDADVKVIHGALEYYAPCTLPFYWCSTLVHRAKVA